ncbi:MAG: UDP-N-acetyl glucosamine 2-epimerase [Sphingomonadales bacterium]|nr:UDP-N-acetyl glucosamine 2-epimerase [Sphingomonadales bacterium]
MKVLTIVGNRPQFIKLGVTARRLRELGADAPWRSIVVNTGQHYDEMLSDVFFTELEIEAPDYALGIGSGHIVDQIGKMLNPLREIIEVERPDALLVYGDTNSTIAGAICAGHLDIPLIHVEGGERLYRRSAMPEEVNRVVTDHLSSLCLASSRKAVRYLAREGFGPDRVQFVGDPMYDIFKLSGELLETMPAKQPDDFGLKADGYALCTIHRAENTDVKDTCLDILEALDQGPLPALLPAHPRLMHRLNDWAWAPKGNLRLVDPLGYFDFQSLLRQCAVAVTDSGGVGREAFFAGKAAIVPLESSAWIEAVEAGLAVMTGQSGERLAEALRSFNRHKGVTALVEHNFGSGDAGSQIVNAVSAFLSTSSRGGEGPWHPVARFEQLPRAADASSLSLDAFARLCTRQKEAGAQALVLNITRSLSNATTMLDLCRRLGARATLWVDPGTAGFNPLNEDVITQIGALAENADGLATSDQKYADYLGEKLQRKVPVLTFPVLQDDSAAEGNKGWADTVEIGKDTPPIRIRPWAWSAVPVGNFEAELQIFDFERDAHWSTLREKLS